MKVCVAYNEINEFCQKQLVSLMQRGMITTGQLISKSVADLRPEDLRSCNRVHFFAGIAGWELALRMAGFPDDVQVWTGSCPCQPFSTAGKKKGVNDDRHLWPVWFELIRQCRPSIIFGEQVASPLGYAWLDTVSNDLENEGYSVGAADLAAASVGSPHIRQRLYWVAYSNVQRREIFGVQRREDSKDEIGWPSKEYWEGSKFALCGDGKRRPIEHGVEPVVDGFPENLAALHAYGNAIVPQVAAAFVEASMDAIRSMEIVYG